MKHFMYLPKGCLLFIVMAVFLCYGERSVLTAERNPLSPTKPNVIFILVDDLGWKDLSITGSTFYETPRIDRLAVNGARFTRAYAACPVCSPTRAALMTGKYPARLKITNWIDAKGTNHPIKSKLIDAHYRKQLPLEEKTMAETFHEAGYATWHIGKWHLGGKGFYPTDQGFDVNIAGCEQGHPWNGYFSPYRFPTMKEGPQGEYLTDRLTTEAISLIKKNANSPQPKPFFLNLWYYSIHTPIQAKKDKLAYFQERKKKLGLDQLTPEEIWEEEKGFSLIPKNYGRKINYRKVQNNAAYAAMLGSLDENIGRIMDTLESLKLLENTIVIFTSDNGGLSTAGGPTSNEPLRAGKAWFYEGGIREPLFVYWPTQIKKGTICDQPIISPDFYPTLLEMTGIPLQPQQHLDGRSFANVLLSKNLNTKAVNTKAVNTKSNNDVICDADKSNVRDLFWHFPHYHSANTQGPGSVILSGNWKLVELFENNTVQLFNLKDDPYEKKDLSKKYSEKVNELKQKLDLWRKEVQAEMPVTNPERPATNNL